MIDKQQSKPQNTSRRSKERVDSLRQLSVCYHNPTTVDIGRIWTRGSHIESTIGLTLAESWHNLNWSYWIPCFLVSTRQMTHLKWKKQGLGWQWPPLSMWNFCSQSEIFLHPHCSNESLTASPSFQQQFVSNGNAFTSESSVEKSSKRKLFRKWKINIWFSSF